MKYLKIITCCVGIICLTDTFAQKSDEIIVPLSNPGERGKLTVDMHKGGITVRGVSRKDVLVRYTSLESGDKNIEKEKDGLKRIASASIDLEVSENNNKVNIDSESWNKGLNLEIEVPKNFDLSIETYNSGDIHIYDIDGQLSLENYNGEITAEGISGSIIANTYNGKIYATFKSVTPDTPMSFITYNGKVDLTFPSSYKANLKAKTARGEIYSAFDFEVIQKEPIKSKSKGGVYKVQLEDWVYGKINGGGPEITIRNYNGDIYLRKN